MMIMRRVPHRLRALAPIAVIAICAAGCGSSSGSASAKAASPAANGTFPVTIATPNGVGQIKSRPKAIVSLSPTATEMLYAIGASRQVEAVDSLSDYPAGAPVTKLSAFQPNVEAIVADKPDLVVISDNINGLEKKLAALSIPVLDLAAPADVNGEYSEFEQLGRATGHVAQARREVATLRSQLAQIVASVPKRSKPLTYYYELDQTYYSVTSSTFVGSLLSLLGMKSIADAASSAASSGGYPQLSPEFIVRANPDYIILADTVCCHQSTRTVSSRPGWSSLTAVKAGHVISLNDDIASRWGPRIIDLLRTVASGVGKGTG
jgi:iron complex transport system substrate-binding protein